MAALAAHLSDHREAILRSWSEAVARDADLTSSDDLSRTEFRDHIPQVLEEFGVCLRQEGASGEGSADRCRSDNSVEHGKHRWKQGYDVREVILEWGHLHRCLLDVLEAASRDHSLALDDEALAMARRTLASLVHKAIADSVERFALLQQKASLQVRQDLERVVSDSIEAGRQRTALWSASAHGLRGQLSIITSATMLLEDSGLDEPLRAETVEILRKGTSTLKAMLKETLENVQTDAIHEERQVTTFDAGALLGGLCAASQPLARERRLSLRSGGPEGMTVEGDRGKILRIAQNLLLDTLSHVSQGTVAVSWQADDAAWWSFRVHGAGPRLPIADDHPERLGLNIVRRLVEILGARMETASAPGGGTGFTVILPRRYAA